MAFADAIKFFPLFGDCSDDEVHKVAKHFVKVDLAKGDPLYFEDEKADRIFFVYFGTVVLTSKDDNGFVTELTRVDDTGALIGDELLFEKKERRCTVTALTETTLFSVNTKGFSKFKQVLPSLGNDLENAAKRREKLHNISGTYPVFSGISKKRQHQLSSICRIMRFGPGSTIIKQGVDGNRMFYVVANGSASVFLGDTIVRELREGDYFGEVGLVSGAPPTATVKASAEGSCYCLTCTQKDFKALFETEPSVLAEFTIRYLGAKVGLADILHHRKGRESFLKFASKEFASENVEFWKAVEDFERLGKRKERKSVVRALNIKVSDVKHKKNQMMAKRATNIIERWVVDDSEEEVSMAGDVKDELLTRYNKGDFSYDMFDRARELVFSIMNSDNFARYKQSKEFAQLLKELGEYEQLK